MVEISSGAQAPDVFADPGERTARIRNVQLGALYRGAFAIPTNIVVALLVCWLVSDLFPISVLAAWMGAVAAVALARLEMQRRFTRANRDGTAGMEWAVYNCAGALASGATWAALCLMLPLYSSADPGDYVLMIVVAAGMSAGSLTTLAAYLPAFLCYAMPFTLAIAGVSLASDNPDIAGNGLLILLYAVMIAVAAWKLNGDITRAIALYIDNQALNVSLTRARAERDGARAEKWSTIAHLSHELRTPLNAILGFTEVMRDQLLGPLGHPRYGEYADHVHTSGEHLLRLVDELLQLSQSETGQLTLTETAVDLKTVAADCVRALAGTAATCGLTLTDALSADLPPLRADNAKLHQILLNLIGNAVKFTPAGGRIRLEATVAVDGGIALTVADTGIGMTPAEIPVALEPFGRVATPLTHQTGGMGLGLPIAARLARLHDAALEVESAPGAGTRCRVAFPPARTLESRAQDAHERAARG